MSDHLERLKVEYDWRLDPPLTGYQDVLGRRVEIGLITVSVAYAADWNDGEPYVAVRAYGPTFTKDGRVNERLGKDLTGRSVYRPKRSADDLPYVDSDPRVLDLIARSQAQFTVALSEADIGWTVDLATGRLTASPGEVTP